MKRKLGIGSSSLLLFCLAIIWGANINKFCFGDKVLDVLGLPAWSNGSSGLHYTIFYSIAFLIPAIIIGNRFSTHLFAKTGKIASIYLCVLVIVTSSLFMAL